MLFRELITDHALGKVSDSKLAFYTKRLSKETGLRRVGSVFIVLALAFQVITFVAPPKPSNAASTNDIIPGGISSKADLLAKMDDPGPYGFGPYNIKLIYGYFGITRNDIANAREADIYVNSGSDLWSIGHNPHSSQDQLKNVGFGVNVYIRPLSSWGAARYHVLTGTDSRGQEFFILFGCGNAAFHGIPSPPPPPPPPPKTTFSCTSLAADKTSGNAPLTINFTGTGQAENTNIIDYEFDFGDGDKTTSASNKVSHKYSEPGNYTATLLIKTGAGKTQGTQVCMKQISVLAPNLHYVKTADNMSLLTADNNPTNAAGTTVPAGTKIRYNIRVSNSGNGTFADFVFRENINDILEYANLTDGDGSSIKDGILTWPAVDIGATSSATKSFIVVVKTPIPAKPVSVSDPQSYDLKMDNVFFNNEVTINLNPPPEKTIETVSEKLPQTGPGIVNTLLALFAAGAVFMYLRSKLLKTELQIAETLR